MPYIITTQAEYDYAKRRGIEPLDSQFVSLEHGLRVQIQHDLFGDGHTPEENERFYRWVWTHNRHQCEECLKPLREYSAVYVSHILTRGAHPEIAHDPRNTNMLCERCHAKWENGNRQTMRIYEANRITINNLIKEYYADGKRRSGT